MLNKEYYVGYEGEGAVKIWSDEDGHEKGLLIWIGYFNTILEGCFDPKFEKNGIIECYYNQDGFYDDRWEMQYPDIVLKEIHQFNENNLETRDTEIVSKSREIIEQLVSFITTADQKEERIYVEYE